MVHASFANDELNSWYSVTPVLSACLPLGIMFYNLDEFENCSLLSFDALELKVSYFCMLQH